MAVGSGAVTPSATAVSRKTPKILRLFSILFRLKGLKIPVSAVRFRPWAPKPRKKRGFLFRRRPLGPRPTP